MSLRIPSFSFYKKRDEWIEEAMAEIAQDQLLSYALAKSGRLKTLKQRLERLCDRSYTLAQDETAKSFGDCDSCKGRGYLWVIDMETKVSMPLFCICKRCQEVKQFIERFYVRKPGGQWTRLSGAQAAL